MALRYSDAILALIQRYSPRRAHRLTAEDIAIRLMGGETHADIFRDVLGAGNHAVATLAHLSPQQVLREASNPRMLGAPARKLKVRHVSDAQVQEGLEALHRAHPRWYEAEVVTGRPAGEGAPAVSPREWVRRYLEASGRHDARTLVEDVGRRLGAPGGKAPELAEPWLRKAERGILPVGKDAGEGLSAVDSAVNFFTRNHAGFALAQTTAQLKEMRRKIQKKENGPNFVRMLGRMRERFPILKSLTDVEIKEVMARSNVLLAWHEREVEKDLDVEKVAGGAPRSVTSRRGEEHLRRHSVEVHSRGYAEEFLRAVTRLKAGQDAAEREIRDKMARDLGRLESRYKAALNALVEQVKRGEVPRQRGKGRVAEYVEAYRERRSAILSQAEESLARNRVEHRREAERLFSAGGAAPYAQWVAAARDRGNVTGEYAAPVRQALALAKEAEFWDHPKMAADRDRRARSLREMQRQAGWEPSELTGLPAARDDLRRRLQPAVEALRMHIGGMTSRARRHYDEMTRTVVAYHQSVTANYSPEVVTGLAGRIELLLAKMNALEDRIEVAHKEWMHLEDILESGVTAEEGAPADPAKRDEAEPPARLKASGGHGELLAAIKYYTRKRRPEGLSYGRREMAEFIRRNVEHAESAYKRQLLGLEPAQRPGTAETDDWVLRSGRYKGYRFSEVPVSHLLWLATGARIKRQAAVNEVTERGKTYPVPTKMPRTFYIDTERTPEEKDPLTGRRTYGSLPRGARRYLRSAEGSRRLEEWVGSYKETPWEERAAVMMGMVPGMAEKSRRIREALESNKEREQRRKILANPDPANPLAQHNIREIERLALDKKRKLALARQKVADEVYYPELNRRLQQMAQADDVANPSALSGARRQEARRGAQKEYQKALRDAQLDDYSLLYREGLGLKMSPEEADWYAKNIQRSSSEFGKSRAPAGFQDTDLTDRVREQAEADFRKEFLYSQRSVVMFMKSAEKTRKQVFDENEIFRGKKDQQRYYRAHYEDLRATAKQDYEAFIRACGRSVPPFLLRTTTPAFSRPDRRGVRRRPEASSYRVHYKPFEELTWYDVYRIGRVFSKGALYGGNLQDFLIPGDVLAFDPQLMRMQKDREYLSNMELAKADPRWRSTDAREGPENWYDVTSPGAARRFAELDRDIRDARTPRQLDKAVRTLLFNFYRGPDEERVLGVLDRNASGYSSVPDVRAFIRTLDFGQSSKWLLSALGEYVAVRHDILSGNRAPEVTTGDAYFDVSESLAARRQRIAGTLEMFDGAGEGYQYFAEERGIEDDDYLHYAILLGARGEPALEEYENEDFAARGATFAERQEDAWRKELLDQSAVDEATAIGNRRRIDNDQRPAWLGFDRDSLGSVFQDFAVVLENMQAEREAESLIVPKEDVTADTPGVWGKPEKYIAGDLAESVSVAANPKASPLQETPEGVAAYRNRPSRF